MLLVKRRDNDFGSVQGQHLQDLQAAVKEAVKLLSTSACEYWRSPQPRSHAVVRLLESTRSFRQRAESLNPESLSCFLVLRAFSCWDSQTVLRAAPPAQRELSPSPHGGGDRGAPASRHRSGKAGVWLRDPNWALSASTASGYQCLAP